MRMIFGAIGGIKFGKGNRSTRRKPTPAPLCPPQNPTWQTRFRTPDCSGRKPKSYTKWSCFHAATWLAINAQVPVVEILRPQWNAASRVSISTHIFVNVSEGYTVYIFRSVSKMEAMCSSETFFLIHYITNHCDDPETHNILYPP
jgi:hypothetical protein